MSNMKIGWSEISITPDKKMGLAGQFAERISTHIEKPLTATAMAVEAGGDQMVYQISNVNINMLGDSTMDKVFPKGGVVDVDSVVRELEAKERLS
jgi:hypothetical protein